MTDKPELKESRKELQRLIWEGNGQQIYRWVEDSNKLGCPYPRSTFTIALESPDWSICHTAVTMHPSWQFWTVPLGLPTEIQKINISNRKGSLLEWEGRTGLGMVLLDWIWRSNRSPAPHISELTKAVYELDFPINSLRYVFFTNVIEENTVGRVFEIYESRERLGYPSDEPQTWTSPSHQYYILLGSTFGKLVAALVLGAWGQGKKRIARIVTFHTGENLGQLNMRFDIEDV